MLVELLPLFAGSPTPVDFTSPARRRAAAPGTPNRQHLPPAANSGLVAALVDVRQRQQVYLDELSPSKP
jgi:hypothetical protein